MCECGLFFIELSELLSYLILDMTHSLSKDLTVKICERFQSHDLSKSLILLKQVPRSLDIDITVLELLADLLNRALDFATDWEQYLLSDRHQEI